MHHLMPLFFAAECAVTGYRQLRKRTGNLRLFQGIFFNHSWTLSGGHTLSLNLIWRRLLKLQTNHKVWAFHPYYAPKRKIPGTFPGFVASPFLTDVCTLVVFSNHSSSVWPLSFNSPLKPVALPVERSFTQVRTSPYALLGFFCFSIDDFIGNGCHGWYDMIWDA